MTSTTAPATWKYGQKVNLDGIAYTVLSTSASTNRVTLRRDDATTRVVRMHDERPHSWTCFGCAECA